MGISLSSKYILMKRGLKEINTKKVIRIISKGIKIAFLVFLNKQEKPNTILWKKNWTTREKRRFIKKKSATSSKGYFNGAIKVMKDKEAKLIIIPKQVKARYLVIRIPPLEIGLLIRVNIVPDFNSSAISGAPTIVRIIGNIIQ